MNISSTSIIPKKYIFCLITIMTRLGIIIILMAALFAVVVIGIHTAQYHRVAANDNNES